MFDIPTVFTKDAFIENNVYLIVITGEYFKAKSRFEIAVLVDTVNMLRHFLSVSIDCSAEPEYDKFMTTNDLESKITLQVNSNDMCVAYFPTCIFSKHNEKGAMVAAFEIPMKYSMLCQHLKETLT